MKNMFQMAVFDMDGVLVDIDSSWRFLHESFHVDSSSNIRSYLSGKIDYKEFMRNDIRLWGPKHIDQVTEILDKVQLMTGAPQAIRTLRLSGCKTAILSAGISILARRVQGELKMDYAFANELDVGDNGMLTGEGVEVVNLLDKVSAFKKLAAIARIQVQDSAVIGDSVFDVPLFKHAGLSIAFNSTDDRVRRAATVVIGEKDLTKILPHIMVERVQVHRTVC